MKIKAVLVIATFVALLATPALLADDAGKAAFEKSGCDKCHSIQAAGIEAKIKSEKMKGPDMDGVGSRHDAEWITKYLKKEVQLDDKSHKGKWDGTDQELKALVDWLASMK